MVNFTEVSWDSFIKSKCFDKNDLKIGPSAILNNRKILAMQNHERIQIQRKSKEIFVKLIAKPQTQVFHLFGRFNQYFSLVNLTGKVKFENFLLAC